MAPPSGRKPVSTPLTPTFRSSPRVRRRRGAWARCCAGSTSQRSTPATCRGRAALPSFPNPTLTPLLREFDYGEYDGLTTVEIHRTRPEWELFRDGCPGGETPE